MFAIFLIFNLTGCKERDAGFTYTTPTAGEERTEITGSSFFDLRYAPAGTFVMGENVQSPTPVVTLSRGFWIAESEVTYKLWHEVYTWAGSNGYTFATAGKEGNDGIPGEAPTPGNTEPVTTISWRDAMLWCNALSENQGLTPVYYTDNGHETVIRSVTDNDSTDSTFGDIAPDCAKWDANGYRLPTEAEWEYASRYRDGSDWTPGDYASGATAEYTDAAATGLVAWYKDNSVCTHPVGQKIANGLGINDMSGNVGEWCWDCWQTQYNNGPLTDPHGPNPGAYRLFRRGNWFELAEYLQCAYRYRSTPYSASSLIGFRHVRNE